MLVEHIMHRLNVSKYSRFHYESRRSIKDIHERNLPEDDVFVEENDYRLTILF